METLDFLVVKNLLVTDGITIRAAEEAHYPHIKFDSHDGYTMAMLTAHEKAHDGKTHNHFSLYTGNENWRDGKVPEGQRRMSRFDLQFGQEKPVLSLEDSVFRTKKSAHAEINLVSPNGTVFTLRVDDKGQPIIKKG